MWGAATRMVFHISEPACGPHRAVKHCPRVRTAAWDERGRKVRGIYPRSPVRTPVFILLSSPFRPDRLDEGTLDTFYPLASPACFLQYSATVWPNVQDSCIADIWSQIDKKLSNHSKSFSEKGQILLYLFKFLGVGYCSSRKNSG